MNAEIVAVGSEMLTPERVDTNSLYLTGELNNLGVEVVGKFVVGDHLERLASAVSPLRLRAVPAAVPQADNCSWLTNSKSMQPSSL